MSLFFTVPDRYIHLGSFPDAQPTRLRIGGAPGFMHGLKAAFISDVHLRPSTRDAQLQALIKRIRDLNADLLLLGGDYAESPEDCLRFFQALSQLHFPLGAWAVPGNNDLESMPTLAQTLSRAGLTLLCNSYETIPLGGGRLEIGGCDDHKYGHPHTENLFSAESGVYRILLSHFPVKPDCACDLMLSGHTHGGQFNLLGITPYSIGFEHRFALLGVKGLHRIGDMRLLIGNGIGISRIPLRLGAAPRLYLLEFSSEDFL